MDKKLFFFGALGLLTLASCSQDEVMSVNRDGDEIAFNVVTNGASRAADVFCNNNLIPSFNVWATVVNVANKDTYINNDLVEYKNGKWENQGGVRYWPANEVTFFAHHNAGEAFNWNNGSPKIENFTVPTDVAQQKDLVYAKKTQTKPTDGQVTLNFRHALSQIVFQAKNTNPKLYVDISEISVCNVNSTGTFTYPTGTDTDNNIVHHATTAEDITYNDSWGNWTTTTTLATYTVDVTTSTPNLNTPVAVQGDSKVVSLTNTNDTDNEFSKKAMLLLPQTSTPWDLSSLPAHEGQTGTYFLVKCRIFNVAGETVDTSKDVCLWGQQDGSTYIAKNVAIPVTLNWTQGKKYVYTFVFGEGNGGYNPEDGPYPVLVPITFNVTVDDFVPVENQDIKMDKPEQPTTGA